MQIDIPAREYGLELGVQKPVNTFPNHLKIKIPVVQNLYFLQNQAELDLKIFYYDRI